MRDGTRATGAGEFTASGQPRAGRATQFMPFAALTGYHDLARQQEHVAEARRDLTDERAEALSQTVACLSRGDTVRVTYYRTDCYVTLSGVVTRVDADFHVLRVGTVSIPFKDIWQLETRGQPLP